jgi:hypothetical protein
MRARWSAALGAAITIGLAAGANGSPQPPAPAPTMAGAAVNFIAFRDRGGTNYVLQAPADYAWLRLFGTKGHPVTRSASLTCPARRTATGGKYAYACSFIMADYAPGKYNVSPPRIMRHADGDAVLTVDPANSTLQIDLKPADVYDATTAPPRRRTEPARSVTLRQVPL